MMEKIIDVMDDISTNIEEAHEKIEKAYRAKGKCPHYAEWLAGMAATHLSFNTKGMETMERMLDDWRREGQHKPDDMHRGAMPVMPGMQDSAEFKEFYQMWKGHVLKRTAKVRSMLDAFNK